MLSPQMVSLDNPAGRLHRLLTQAKGIDLKTRVRDAWMQLLNVNPADVPTLFRRMARVLEIPNRIERQIRTLAEREDLDLDLHLRWMGPVEDFLYFDGLRISWDNVVGKVGSDAMQTLEFCDHLLHRRHPEPMLNQEQLIEIAAEIGALLTEVLELNLSQPVRDLIVRHLRAILDAIDDYPHHGSPHIEYAIQAAAGTFIVNRETYTQASGDDLTALQKFLGGVWKLAGALGIVSSLLQLPPAIQHYLPIQHNERPQVVPDVPDTPHTTPAAPTDTVRTV